MGSRKRGARVRKSFWWSLPIATVAVVAAVSLYSQGRAVPAAVPMPGGDSFRILLGVTDQQATPWDGTITAPGGGVASINGWRFNAADSIEGTSWKCSTRRGAAANANAAAPM